MKQHLVALCALALAGASCGGSGDRAPGNGGDAKAEEAGGEALAQPTAAPRVEGATRPARADDLAMTAFGPTPIGPLAPEHARDYPIHVALSNTSEDPITLGTLRLHASVYRDGLLLPGCEGDAPASVEGAPEVIGPGMSMLLAHPMPCGLTTPGDYEVVSVVMIGAPPDAPRMDGALRCRKSAAMPVRVDASMAPYRMEAAPEDQPERASRSPDRP